MKDTSERTLGDEPDEPKDNPASGTTPTLVTALCLAIVLVGIVLAVAVPGPWRLRWLGVLTTVVFVHWVMQSSRRPQGP